MDNKLIDKYLEEALEREKLNEIDPLTGTLIFGSIGIIVQLTIIFSGLATLYKKSKSLPKYEKKLNKLIGGKWEVRSINMKTPSAFTGGGLKIIWITDALVKLLNEREMTAILLHETYHQIDHRFLKHTAFQYPLFYIFTYALLTAALPGGLLLQALLSMLCFRLMLIAADMPYRCLLKKKQEMRADDFAIKYGYGDDLISAIDKMESKLKNIRNSEDCGTWCKAVNSVSKILIEHPQLRERVTKISTKDDIYVASKSGNFKNIKNVLTKSFQAVS